MNELMIGQWIVLGAVITLMIFDKVKAWQIRNEKKSNPGNPGPHGERIAKLEKGVENIEEDIKNIWEKLNKMNSYRK